MATYLAPSPHIYDPQHTASQAYFESYPDAYATQFSQDSRYYPYPGGPSAGSFAAPHIVSGASVVSDESSLAHPRYGDADVAVIQRATEHVGQPVDEWIQPNHPHEDMQPPRPFYEPGEVSPASDDSAGPFYESPQSYAHTLADNHHHGSYDRACSAGHYDQACPTLVVSANQLACEQGSGGYSPSYDYGQVSPVSCEDGGSFNTFHNYRQSLCSGYIKENGHHMHSLDFPSDALVGDYRQRRSSARYAPERQQRNAPIQPPARSQSPMAHLPYQDADTYRGRSGHRHHSPLSSMSEYSDTSVQSGIERPQPVYANSYTSQRPAFPTPIAIPAPRSPPLVEDTPKKPLTLACLFCRKRKIACGSPPPGKKDRTCNQCARRNLQCVYPVNSRRGTRQRELEALAPATF